MPSTIICTYEYDAVRQTLRICYQSGLVYEYECVPPEIYDQFKNYREKVFSSTNTYPAVLYRGALAEAGERSPNA